MPREVLRCARPVKRFTREIHFGVVERLPQGIAALIRHLLQSGLIHRRQGATNRQDQHQSRRGCRKSRVDRFAPRPLHNALRNAGPTRQNRFAAQPSLEVIRQRSCRLVAIARAFLQALHRDRRQIAVDTRQRRRRLVLNLTKNLAHAVAPERLLATH
ncbi:MAG: hypothetical protein ACI8UO_005765 [Verrucomicrobiales bacterium]